MPRLVKDKEPLGNGRLSSELTRPEMGSVKTPRPVEGVERKQKLFAFLQDLCFTLCFTSTHPTHLHQLCIMSRVMMSAVGTLTLWILLELEPNKAKCLKSPCSLRFLQYICGFKCL